MTLCIYGEICTYFEGELITTGYKRRGDANGPGPKKNWPPQAMVGLRVNCQASGVSTCATKTTGWQLLPKER
jgi:hypothetical protein